MDKVDLDAFFNSFEDGCVPIEPVTFSWGAKGIGFGQMHFYFDEKDGYVHCDNEMMGREFLKKRLCQMVDNCVLDCPGSFDMETDGKPQGYTPKPSVSNEPIFEDQSLQFPELDQ